MEHGDGTTNRSNENYYVSGTTNKQTPQNYSTNQEFRNINRNYPINKSQNYTSGKTYDGQSNVRNVQNLHTKRQNIYPSEHQHKRQKLNIQTTQQRNRFVLTSLKGERSNDYQSTIVYPNTNNTLNKPTSINYQWTPKIQRFQNPSVHNQKTDDCKSYTDQSKKDKDGVRGAEGNVKDYRKEYERDGSYGNRDGKDGVRTVGRDNERNNRYKDTGSKFVGKERDYRVGVRESRFESSVQNKDHFKQSYSKQPINGNVMVSNVAADGIRQPKYFKDNLKDKYDRIGSSTIQSKNRTGENYSYQSNKEDRKDNIRLMYHVAKPPPNANIKPMTPEISRLTNHVQTIPSSRLLAAQYVDTTKYSVTPAIYSANNALCVVSKPNFGLNVVKSTSVPTGTNVDLFRMHSNIIGNPLNPKVVRLPPNLVLNPPNTNLLRMPRNVVGNTTNVVYNHANANIVRLPPNVIGNPSNNNMVRMPPANVVYNPPNPNIVRLPGNVIGNSSNPNIFRMLSNPSNPKVVRLPGNVGRNPSNANMVHMPTLYNPSNANIVRLPPNVVRNQSNVNPVRMPAFVGVTPPHMRMIQMQYLPAPRQNTSSIMRYNQMPTPVMQRPTMQPPHGNNYRARQSHTHNAGRMYSGQYVPSRNIYHGKQTNYNTPNKVSERQNVRHNKPLVKKSEVNEGHSESNICKSKKVWFDEECSLLYEKRQCKFVELRTARRKQGNEKEIEELKECIKKINNEYIPLVKLKKSKYIENLESKGEIGLLCEMVVTSLIDRVVRSSKQESKRQRLDHEGDNDDMTSKDYVGLLSNDDFDEMDYEDEDDDVLQDSNEIENNDNDIEKVGEVVKENHEVSKDDGSMNEDTKEENSTGVDVKDVSKNVNNSNDCITDEMKQESFEAEDVELKDCQEEEEVAIATDEIEVTEDKNKEAGDVELKDSQEEEEGAIANDEIEVTEDKNKEDGDVELKDSQEEEVAIANDEIEVTEDKNEEARDVELKDSQEEEEGAIATNNEIEVTEDKNKEDGGVDEVKELTNEIMEVKHDIMSVEETHEDTNDDVDDDMNVDNKDESAKVVEGYTDVQDAKEDTDATNEIKNLDGCITEQTKEESFEAGDVELNNSEEVSIADDVTVEDMSAEDGSRDGITECTKEMEDGKHDNEGGREKLEDTHNEGSMNVDTNDEESKDAEGRTEVEELEVTIQHDNEGTKEKLEHTNDGRSMNVDANSEESKEAGSSTEVEELEVTIQHDNDETKDIEKENHKDTDDEKMNTKGEISKGEGNVEEETEEVNEISNEDFIQTRDGDGDGDGDKDEDKGRDVKKDIEEMNELDVTKDCIHKLNETVDGDPSNSETKKENEVSGKEVKIKDDTTKQSEDIIQLDVKRPEDLNDGGKQDL